MQNKERRLTKTSFKFVKNVLIEMYHTWLFNVIPVPNAKHVKVELVKFTPDKNGEPGYFMSGLPFKPFNRN